MTFDSAAAVPSRRLLMTFDSAAAMPSRRLLMTFDSAAAVPSRRLFPTGLLEESERAAEAEAVDSREEGRMCPAGR